MKKFIIPVVVVLFFVVSAHAEMGEQKGMMCQQGMMMGEGQQMPMMNCPKMQQGQGMMQCCPQMPMMMRQSMMMRDMMQMMMDMMKMQEKLLKGVKGSEKQQAIKDMAQMKEKIQNMMSMCKCMMMGGMMGQHSDISQCRLNCAEQWLKKAIDLHEVHIKDPKTATEASQMEMMEQMKKAYDCIIGISEICGAPLKESPSKEIEELEPSETEPHKH